MGFLGWIMLGLIAGAIAKAIMPGRQGGGWLSTILLGVVGAILGGWIGSTVFHVGIYQFWSLRSWLLAVLGSLIVLFIWGLVRGRRA
ncbi:GlsB/YeaQ/YmgE family stress response membrane protein [Acidipropionibacterium jensenii]|uniref:GlsB/YeaQ/YmgE family stress response membrane protein n=1 Tax=Acidipropionibacterium jensenii TaxID=1749 RepID=A0A3S4W9U2_9ACTN|nr:GlsB/YeaQ/YmgE family stress response membrane protein [Acidipropionibacterium jensenii]AZZ38976.1 GlsB/YeaQ/YmgE family stress response membrane protein [Acidipropionibacterium jensenii]AZZ42655.1 GlsB/YeaQ/YmgE family stress response membrane protein [Acidipropionibacterium jensenii]MDN5978483.1 GlsB/YeaQ/YmgE family stress response membrane protein [Acidipropionibacterium jensenii]MDN5997439.1 GlsB/YeaQ/YmgE family stress response membrane protein [Acidipropionibacterium jensenii]MDN6021